ncbi:ribosome maturation factor RimP, partial [Brevibacterium paucivorans]
VDLAGDTTEAVSSDLIEQATRVISEVIDPLPLFNDKPYELEVSSPGALRPLTEPRHFRRNVGRTIEVRPTEGKKTTGVLTGVTGLGIVLEPGSGRKPVEFSFDGIE